MRSSSGPSLRDLVLPISDSLTAIFSSHNARKIIAHGAGFLHHLSMIGPTTNLDDRDQKILSALAEDAWQTYAELGRLVNLSASATQRRVEKLKAAGIITGARATIDAGAIGRQLHLFVLVELQDEASDQIEKFRERLNEEGRVTEAHYIAGADDILILMSVENMSQYVSFAEKFLNENPNVKKYKTLTSMKRLV